MGRVRASGPARVGELRGDQTAHLGAQHIRQHHRQSREAAVQLREQLILRRGPCQHPAATLHRPPGELSDRRYPGRPATP